MKASEDVCLVLCTCPDEESAGSVARALLEEELAACVNVLPGIGSVYRWQGEVCTDPEYLLLIKTVRARVPALEQLVLAVHPYELPEIITVPVEAGLPGYLDWVRRSVGADAGEGESAPAGEDD